MHSRKTAGPKMKPWGALTLIGYSREGLLSRNMENCLLLRNAELKSNITSLGRGPCQTSSEALDIFRVTA